MSPIGQAWLFCLAGLAATPMSFAGAAATRPAGILPYHHDFSDRRCCLVIAHAAGGIDGNAYTNSEEAMLANLEMGVRVFEIDFSRTSDGVWVGTHDWTHWQKQTGYSGTLPPSLDAFKRQRIVVDEAGAIAGRYTPITLPFLEAMARRHRDLIIVSDTKYDLGALAHTLKESSLFASVYPQAYGFEDIARLREAGFRRIVLTLYKMGLNDPESLLKKLAAARGSFHALTVPMHYFAAHHRALGKLGIPVYVHGSPGRINSRELQEKFRNLGVSGFYLD